jgi:alpha/beta superfamily hydrolase
MDLGYEMGAAPVVADVSGAATKSGAAARRIEPVVFDGHLGSLHQPSPGRARGVTVVLCPPVGRDARCAYRPLFLFAEALADQGFSVLRYDNLGGGDSMAVDPEVDHWPLWTAGAERAAAFAREATPGATLVLGGLRIGASLAVLAAGNVNPDALLLLAPVGSGRAWVRELQVAAAIVGLEPPADGSVEIDGLRLSCATMTSVAGFDLKKLRPAAIPTFLATPAPDPRLAASLGATVTTAPFEGYAELFKEAHLNSPPSELFETAAAWLRELPRGASADAPARARLPQAQLVTDDWTELPVSFGDGLRGVLCLPVRPTGAQSVIFGNTGGDPRAGIGGFATRASRALASQGVAALRFDFTGLGESDSRGVWRPHVYETSRTDDLRAASDLVARHGYPDAIVAGVCAGGYQALRAAVEDARFRRVMTINSWLVWRPHDPLELQRPVVAPRRRVNVFALMRPSGWRRLITGEVPAQAALAMFFRRLRQRLSFRQPDAAGRIARAEIARIAARGADIRVVVGRDDESMDGLEVDFGLKGRWLARQGIRIVTLPGLDHGLFSVESQNMALAEIARFLGLPAGAPSKPRRPRRGRSVRSALPAGRIDHGAPASP